MKTPVTELSGIGPSLSVVLADHGYDCVETIASSSVESLSAVPGFGPIKAEAMISAAKSLTASDNKKSKKKKKDKAKLKAKTDKQKKKKKKKKGGKNKKGKAKKDKKSGKKGKSKKGKPKKGSGKKNKK